MNKSKIRNFSIIAHIDHGKSTLADRMIEITKTIEKRKMKAQVLDNMELERERGITIKMQPVTMKYIFKNEEYILNLIDTPGHIDFYYEVSRAMHAVEGTILLVDATQGIQAQTLTTLRMAQKANLKIIPALSKTDSPLSRPEEIAEELAILLDCDTSEILKTSSRTGEGVEELLQKIINDIPAPQSTFQNSNDFRALIFDFKYHKNRGIIVFVRVLDGQIKKRDTLKFKIAKEKFQILELGIISPEETPQESLSAGQIGYIVTGIKKPGVVSVGDTLVNIRFDLPAWPGYDKPSPVVWASIYPNDQDDFDLLRSSLEKLQLTDSSLSFEEETSGSLGRGFRCGFLGMLHLEIITERLKREFGISLIITSPTIIYKVTNKSGEQNTIYNPAFFPEHGEILEIQEPWVRTKIMTPNIYTGAVSQLLFHFEGNVESTIVFGDERVEITAIMPLRELMRGFFDKLKSVTSGYASISYEIEDYKIANVIRLDIFLADEKINAFSKIISIKRLEEESKQSVEKLYSIIPRQNFVMKIQAKANGRIIASKTVKAFRKDVTAKLYGGDITRKKKLLEKQKKGKRKMKDIGRVNIPQDVFLKMMKSD